MGVESGFFLHACVFNCLCVCVCAHVCVCVCMRVRVCACMHLCFDHHIVANITGSSKNDWRRDSVLSRWSFLPLLFKCIIGFVFASDHNVNITDAHFCKVCYPSAFATSFQVYHQNMPILIVNLSGTRAERSIANCRMYQTTLGTGVSTEQYIHCDSVQLNSRFSRLGHRKWIIENEADFQWWMIVIMAHGEFLLTLCPTLRTLTTLCQNVAEVFKCSQNRS